ncbi:MAG: beta-propeller domain-containing protein, partial [Sandaracinaceae bacterium]
TRCGTTPERPRVERPSAENLEQASRLVREQTREELHRFGSETELRETLEHLAEAARLRGARHGGFFGGDEEGSLTAEATESPTDGASEDSITNNQVAGVDEGGIVKTHGDHLVVLRRGRLFSVRIGDTSLTPVSMVDAYPSGAPGGWYDEMLVHGDTIVVIGFNYTAGGTEIGLFDIDGDGAIERRSTQYLRSNDYYSSRNYASRLIDDRLVFYMPYYLSQTRWEGEQPRVDVSMPSIRSQGDEAWEAVITASQIYRPIQEAMYPALHTVVSCPLDRTPMRCTAQGILGPASRSFYVSRDAVYVWVGGDHDGDDDSNAEVPSGAVYRMPFDGSPIGAVRVTGMPTDQFSFQEQDGQLNVIVRALGHGDWMWAPEVSDGDIALVQLPPALFTDGVATASRDAYTRLPRIEGWAFQNRFVGDHLLYGIGGGWGDAEQASSGQVVVHDLSSGGTSIVPLPHVVDRIEVMGRDAVVVGSGGGALHFSAVELDESPSVVGHYAQPGASQGETRSHGFFYRAENDEGGMLGLPIRGSDGAGWHHLVEGSAGVLFLDVRNRRFEQLGVLGSRSREVNDHCQASCVDWYGNARPIFYRGRVFALLGYELVEGTVDGSAIREVRRTHMYRDHG